MQRRAFVEISFDEAARLARFLANVEDGMIVGNGDDPPTDPSRPTNIPPPELREMTMPRTRSRNVTGNAIPRIDDGNEDAADDADDQ